MMNNLYKATILTYSRDMFAAETASIMSNFMAELALNNPSEMLLVQFKDACQYDVDRFIDANFLRTDGQYLYQGEFIYRHDLENLIKPYCKEMCISVVPKGPKEAGKHIDTEKQYGYITIANVVPFMASNYREVK